MSIPSLVGLAILTLTIFVLPQRYTSTWFQQTFGKRPHTSNRTIHQKTQQLSERHEVAATLAELIQKDGAGSWPPQARHDRSFWPVAIRPYQKALLEMMPMLPREEPSLDLDENAARVSDFRLRYRKLLHELVDMVEVRSILEAADAGRWDVVSRDVYNAFYCCIATSRHTYRWATIPVVKSAQLEKEVDLPFELMEPWEYLQQYFGCASQSENNTSNLILNFDTKCQYQYQINSGLSKQITSAEEAFARIFHQVEVFGVPIYYDMVMAIICFAEGNKAICARHVSSIAAQLRHVLRSYFDHLHNKEIALSVWLSRVQGFYAWGVGSRDDETGDWVKFDGLSGNQVLLFQAVDAFLGLEQYLSDRDRGRNVPVRQRALCRALAKHSFRRKLDPMSSDDPEKEMSHAFGEIVKQMRVFRHTHRIRAKAYLAHPAPERLPMTAGKSLLEPTIGQSLDFLDSFMLRRLDQTR